MAASDIIDVSIGGDSTLLEQAFAKAINLGGGFAKNIEGIGVEVAGLFGLSLGGGLGLALLGLTDSAIKLGDQIYNLSQQTGLSIDEFEALSFVARENGSSAEQAAKGVIHLRDELAKAADGSKDAQNAFAAVGLNWRELVNIPIGQAVQKVSSAMLLAGEDTSTFGAAMNLLGAKNAPALQAGLKELGEKGFGEISKWAREAGQALGEDAVKQLHASEDAINRLKMAITIFAGESFTWLEDRFKTKPILEVQEAWLKLQHIMEQSIPGQAGDAELIYRAQIEYIKRLMDAKTDLSKLDLEYGMVVLQAEKSYLTQRGEYNGATVAKIEEQEIYLFTKKNEYEAKSAEAAKAAADSKVEAEKKSAEQRANIIHETLSNLDAERVKPLTDLLKQLGGEVNQNLSGPIDAYNVVMERLNALVKEGTLSQEDFAKAANLAADALAKTGIKGTAIEEFTEKMRVLNEQFARGMFTGPDAYNEAVKKLTDSFVVARTPAEELKLKIDNLNLAFAGGGKGSRMSAEAYADAVAKATYAADQFHSPAEKLAEDLRQIESAHRDGTLVGEEYVNVLASTMEAAHTIKDPLEQYYATLLNLKILVDNNVISQEALALAIRGASEAAGASQIAELNRNLGIDAAGGSASSQAAVAQSRSYIDQARAAAARGDTEQATWLFNQAQRTAIQGHADTGTTLEDVLGKNMQPGLPKPGDVTDAGKDKGAVADLPTEVHGLTQQLKSIADKLTTSTNSPASG